MRAKLIHMTPLRAGIAAAVVAGGVAGGGIALAATTTPSVPAAHLRSARHAKLAAQRANKLTHQQIAHGVTGKVVSDSSSGGIFGQGSITIAEPNGSTMTFSLSNESHAWKFSGTGTHPSAESPTSLPQGEVVAVRGVQVESGQYWAPNISDTGFAAS
ncbi:MAG: hypothetical protein M1115_09845 [Actinobacteria bacterium]|nr:hypothetical protein [Actinomycetota bacterium]